MYNYITYIHADYNRFTRVSAVCFVDHPYSVCIVGACSSCSSAHARTHPHTEKKGNIRSIQEKNIYLTFVYHHVGDPDEDRS